MDDAGNVEYSDQYRQGAEKVEIREVQTISLPPADSRLADELQSDREDREEAAAERREPYRKLEITFPENDTAFNSGGGDFSVTTAVEPALLPTHQLRLSINGKIAGTTRGGFFNLTQVERGTHTLKLEVIDSTNVVQEAAPVTFTLHRPSVLLPPRQAN